MAGLLLFDEVRDELNGKVRSWLDKWLCSLDLKHAQFADRYLLAGILLNLAELRRASAFGSTYFKINPVALVGAASAVRIVDKETSNRVRKVSLWVDSASGGPTPTVRVSTGAFGTGGGGIRVNAGQVNELGEVPPQSELWAASTADISMYVIERA